MADNQTAVPPALAEILAKPTTIRTYRPPHPGGLWKATVLRALGAIGDPLRPYEFVGVGETERSAIDHLYRLEAADTWSAETHG